MTGLRAWSLLVGVCGVNGNDVNFCDDKLEGLVCCRWECVGLVVMMWSFVMTVLRGTGLLLLGVCGFS